MGLMERLDAVVVARLERLAAEVGQHAPPRDARPSIVVPQPEDLPDVLERARAYWRIGQPDIHLGGERRPSPFLARTDKGTA
jgi:hypothetical protein